MFRPQFSLLTLVLAVSLTSLLSVHQTMASLKGESLLDQLPSLEVPRLDPDGADHRTLPSWQTTRQEGGQVDAVTALGSSIGALDKVSEVLGRGRN